MLQLAFQANPRDRWIGFAVADGALANLAVLNTQSYDEKTVLESVLKIRPDHPEALTRLWLMEKRNGNTEKAQHYKARLASISPFAKVLRKSD